MNDNNNGFDSMNDLDGFLGGYDSSDPGRNKSYNYGSTYNKKDPKDTNDYYSSNGSYYNDNNGYNNNSGYIDNSGNGYNSNNDYNAGRNSFGEFGSDQYNTANYQGMPNNGGYIPVKNNFDHSTYGGRTVSGGYGSIPQYQGAPVPSQNDFVSGNNNSSFNNGYNSYKPQKIKLSVPSAAIRTLLPMIAVLIPLCILLVLTVNSAMHYNDIKNNGVSVTATVTNVTKSTKTTTNSKGRTKKTTTYTAHIQYLYNGKYYTGTLNENHTQGSKVTVYIDPDNPSDFISERGSTGIQIGMWVLIIFTSLIVIIFITRFIQMITGNYTPPRRRRRARISIR